MRRIFAAFVVCVTVAAAGFLESGNSVSEELSDIDNFLPKCSNEKGLVQAGSASETEVQGGIIAGAYAASIPKMDTAAIFQKSGEPHASHKTINPLKTEPGKADNHLAHRIGSGVHDGIHQAVHSGETPHLDGDYVKTESDKYKNHAEPAAQFGDLPKENLLGTDFDDAGYQAEEHGGHEGGSTLGMLIRGGAAVIGNVVGGIVRTGTGIVRTGAEVVGNVTSRVVQTGTGIVRTGTGIVGNVTSTVVRTGTGIVRTGTGIVGNVTSSVVRTGTGIVRTGSNIVENVGVGLVKTGVEIVRTGTEIAEGVGFGIVHTGSDIVATGSEIVRAGTGVVADVGSGIVKTGTEIVGAVGNDFVEKGTKIVGDVAKIVRSNINETAQNVRSEFTRHREQLVLEQSLPSGPISRRSLETSYSAATSSASTRLPSSASEENSATNNQFPPGLHV